MTLLWSDLIEIVLILGGKCFIRERECCHADGGLVQCFFSSYW